MLKKMEYLFFYYGNWGLRILFTRLTSKKLKSKYYVGKRIESTQEGNDLIRNSLLLDKPFLAARFGSSELRAVADTSAVDCGVLRKIRKNTISVICRNAGFFPNSQDSAIKFGYLMMNSAKKTDLIGVWYNVMEDYIIKYYAKQSRLCNLRGIEPFYCEKPWTSSLKGKKVLVIHPFSKSIESQYKKREILFKNKDMLPEFDLKILRAVQTIAGQNDKRFENWFEALDYMYDEAMKLDFEVAIIGCGAYGFPLAAKLKDSGKKVIHMGGATQLLFGIKGKRWDGHPILSNLYNEHFVRPLIEEFPEKANDIEGACYW